MDLYEYQARDMFEAHGVPVLRGITATTPEEARAAAAELGTPVVVVKAQVKTGGRGKAGGVKIARSPDEAAERARRHPRHGHQGPHRSSTVMIAEGADIAEEYYFSLLLDRANRRYLAMCSQRGRHGHRDAGRRAARGPGPGRRSTRRSASTRRRPTRSWPRPGSPATTPREIARVLQLLWEVYRVRGRHAGRGEPAGQDRRRVDHRAGRQGVAGRERRLPPARARGAGRQVGRGPAGGGGQGEGPELRQARRVGGDHRQRGGPGDEHPGRGRVRGGGVRGLAQAGQLPRHRRRGQRRGDGQRAGDHHLRRPGARACSSTSSAASPPATRWPTGSCRRSSCWPAGTSTSTCRWSSGWTATTPSWAGQILTDAELPGLEQVDTMDGAARRAAELAAAG